MTPVALPAPQIQTWIWQGFPIRYQQAGAVGAPILCIHGFGASSEHWHKNLPALAETNRVYAIDLLGFGLSAKPTPNNPLPYTFETWGEQVLAFCREVIGEPAFLVGNSVGCIVALQAGVMAPEWVRSIAMLDCSLRLLHDRKRESLPWHRRATTPLFQKLLGYRPFGHFFFSRLAQPQVIRKVLKQAYHRPDTVTENLVNSLLEPALQPGAADVFLAFVRYSQGPLAEDLLPNIACPVLILWGEKDPWEPVDLGREMAQFSAVEDFIVLEEVGHCPQDEAPELVNPILQQWVKRHTDSVV
ncbi:MAG TPA: alpha/beta fold hydrolase [Leptolyngbyaceae cyanobacterium]